MYRQPTQLPHVQSTLTSTALSVTASPVNLTIAAPPTGFRIAVTGYSFNFGTAFTGPYTTYLRQDSLGGTIIATVGVLHSSSAVSLFYPILAPAGHAVVATVSLTVTGHTCDISLQYFLAEGQQ